MTAPNKNELIRAGAVLLRGDADAAPSTPVGHVPQDEEGTIEFEFEDYPLLTQAYAGAIMIPRDYTAMMFKVPVFQVEPGNLSSALGLESNATLYFGGATPSSEKEYSWKMITPRYDGTTLIANIPAARPSDALSLAMTRTAWTKIALSVKSLDGDGRAPSLAVNGGSINLTISTGVTGTLTRVLGIGYARVFGYGGAADVLDVIAGAGLVDDEVLIVQLGSIGQAITLTHLAGTLELLGAIDWVMNAAGDYIVLQYDEAGTKWVETGRFDSPY